MCTMNAMSSVQTYKRIPVSPRTWEKLSILKKPGETFDHLIADLIEEREKLDIIRRVEKGSEEGEFLSLDEAEEARKE